MAMGSNGLKKITKESMETKREQYKLLSNQKEMTVSESWQQKESEFHGHQT